MLYCIRFRLKLQDPMSLLTVVPEELPCFGQMGKWEFDVYKASPHRGEAGGRRPTDEVAVLLPLLAVT